jgi:type IV secretion system protein TrbI
LEHAVQGRDSLDAATHRFEAGANDNEGALTQALRQGSSQGFNHVGEQVVGRSLNVQPTITIRPGFPVRIIVNRDLVLG